MSWARDEVLFRAQFGLFGLKAVHNRVYRGARDRSPDAVAQATIDLIRLLVDEGLAVVGDRTEQGFVPWTDPIGDELAGIREAYAAAIGNRGPGGPDLPWLSLTEAGRQAAAAVPVDTGDTRPSDAVKQWDWPLPAAAQQLLIYGTIDWIELGQIHWRVTEVSQGEPVSVVAQRTLELTADLVRGGLAELGSFDADALGFVRWDDPLDSALRRISAVYVDNYEDPMTWEWFCMLELTRKGELVARAIKS